MFFSLHWHLFFTSKRGLKSQTSKIEEVEAAQLSTCAMIHAPYQDKYSTMGPSSLCIQDDFPNQHQSSTSNIRNISMLNNLCYGCLSKRHPPLAAHDPKLKPYSSQKVTTQSQTSSGSLGCRSCLGTGHEALVIELAGR